MGDYTARGLPNRDRDHYGLSNNLHLPPMRHPQHSDRRLRMSLPSSHRLGHLPVQAGQMPAIPGSLPDRLHRHPSHRLRWTNLQLRAPTYLIHSIISHPVIDTSTLIRAMFHHYLE